MCRLSIVDVESGHQPNYNSNEQIVSVFNGEIYNFQDLRRKLESRGHSIKSSGDSALIPFLYEEFGLAFVKHLQGMFAIAIFDNRSQELVLIRDRLGKKPLWYHESNEGISFCSELKGLLALGIPKNFDYSTLTEYLQFGFINAPRSPYLGAKQLEPATILRFSQGRSISQKFWSTNEIESISITFEEAKRVTTSLLEKAVSSRLVSERPIGTFLSGGIDSTIVTALMAKISEDRVHSFSIGFRDNRYDESKHAKAVAQSIGTQHHERLIEPDPELILNVLSKSLDSPFADSSIIPTYLLAEFARKEVVVALSGDGGDESFGGYQRYIASFLMNKLNWALYFNPLSRLPMNHLENERIRKFIRHSKYMNINQRYRSFMSLFSDEDLLTLLKPDLLNEDHELNFLKLWDSIYTNDSMRKLQEVDIKSYLPGDLLFKVDMTSMANSLEVRSPFLDYRVVEFGLSLPRQFKFANRENKHLLREIAREFVPKHLIDRPKMGFGIPRARWLRSELKQLVSDVILNSNFRNRNWFNYQEVEKVIQEHNRGKNLDHIIWPILMLELWALNWLDS
jgi:asparagine synthase (glutamine-hydrolysing)